MSSPVCFINNQFITQDHAAVGISDLGLQRGYGVFDFLRITNNQPLFLDEHLDRFYQSAATMYLQVQPSRADLKEIIQTLIRHNDLPHSGIRITLTGGASPDGYQIGQPNLLIMQQAINPPPTTLVQKPYKLAVWQHQRQLPHVKTTDYLMAIWLQPRIIEQHAHDVLYHNNGIITECPRSNFFMVTKDDTVVTPSEYMLKGITRKQVLDIAASHFKTEERNITLDELARAKEVFITSSTKRILPVTQVDSIVLPPQKENGVGSRLFRLFLEREANITKQ